MIIVFTGSCSSAPVISNTSQVNIPPFTLFHLGLFVCLFVYLLLFLFGWLVGGFFVRFLLGMERESGE